ncbi:MAG TPA: iron-sulfur cluster assembly accessory protein [Candidatus Acidoferrales bacterium]|nr:iron-sulfur cluster assembly accessory protein [Candidatus Acidoferrales bacterium]
MVDVETLQQEIRISDKAAGEIKKVMTENKIPDTFGLRMGVKGGGCSGFTYVLGFDEKASETDRVFDANGVRVFVDERSLPYLSGILLDYQEGLTGKGFTFDNPNATRSCGCGHSFNA